MVNETIEQETLESLAVDQCDRAAEYVGSPHVFCRRIAPGKLEGCSFKPYQVPVSMEKLNRNLRVPRSVPSVAWELLSYSLPEAVGRYHSSSSISTRKLAFNFWNHYPGFYGEPDIKRTIEFCQCAGTLDGEEVVAFSKIFIRLCEFAGKVTNKDLSMLAFNFEMCRS